MSERRGAVDEVALQAFLTADSERLRRYITSRIPPDLRAVASPDDLLQEVWISAFRGLSEFRADGPDALARWSTTLANRRLIDTFKAARALKRRGARRAVRLEYDRESSMVTLFDRVAPCLQTPSSEVSAKEAARAIRIALASLPDDHRRVIWMRHIEGHSIAEIAEVLHRTEAAVGSLLFRARKQLGTRLGRASKFFSDVSSAGDRTS